MQRLVSVFRQHDHFHYCKIWDPSCHYTLKIANKMFMQMLVMDALDSLINFVQLRADTTTKIDATM